ncbi:MAG: sugar kinase [Alphaproteobacteria bacterium]|nr:sugar kinase [Alphaproteobacteria bacterium]
MTRRMVSIGECMVEMSATGEGTFRLGFAGDTFNAAWHARRALPGEWTVAYFTAVGDDSLSRRMLTFMAEQGVETDRIRRLANRRPGLYLIELNNGERSFTYWRDTSAARGLADDPSALADAMAGADAIMFSGITLAILPPEGRARLLAAAEAARANGAIIAFDSNLRLRLWTDADTARKTILEAARVATLALPTLSDESELFGDRDAEATAQRYRAAGVSEVVVKAGPDAALVSWPGGQERVAPERPITPVDTTGAGDSFNGAYIAARLSGDDPVAATRKAHVTAGRVIQSYGALV